MERETDFRVTMIGEKNFPWFERFLNEKPSGEQAGLGLIMDDRACGAAVFSIEDVVCTLHYLFIPEEERRKGGASFLLHSAMEAMRDYQVSEMMVCYSPDEGLEAFLAKMGFVCAPSLTLRSFKAVDLIDSPECRKSIARLKMEGVIPFASLSRKHRLEWAALASEQGFSPELTEDGRFDQELSFAILEDRNVTGALLADRKKEQSANAFYVTELLYTGAKIFGAFFLQAAFLNALAERADVWDKVYYVSMNPGMDDLLTELIGNKHAVKEEEVTRIGLLSF